MNKTSEYKTWQSIRQRCNNPNDKDYKLYGGRGIQVCERWEGGFLNFYEDMGDKPSKKHQIDRMDNDGDYCPENCRWVEPKKNIRNRSNTIMVDTGEGQISLGDLSERSGIHTNTLRERMLRGWSGDELEKEAVPRAQSHTKDHMLTAFGKTQKLSEWAKECGISYRALQGRVRRGWSPEDALNGINTQTAKLVKSDDGHLVPLSQLIDESPIGRSTIMSRLNKGWSLEDALNKPAKDLSPRKISAFGKTLTLTEWAAETGMGRTKIKKRLKRGWSPERALSTEGTATNAVAIEINGVSKTVDEWAEDYGIVSGATIRKRLKAGWSPERAVSTPSKRK